MHLLTSLILHVSLLCLADSSFDPACVLCLAYASANAAADARTYDSLSVDMLPILVRKHRAEARLTA